MTLGVITCTHQYAIYLRVPKLGRRARRLRSTSMRSSSFQSLSNNITFNASIKQSNSITNNHKPLCLSL